MVMLGADGLSHGSKLFVQGFKACSCPPWLNIKMKLLGKLVRGR